MKSFNKICNIPCDLCGDFDECEIKKTITINDELFIRNILYRESKYLDKKIKRSKDYLARYLTSHKSQLDLIITKLNNSLFMLSEGFYGIK